MSESTRRGRPPGLRYTRSKSLKLREEDLLRLMGLAAKMDRDQSWVIREAVARMAKQEGVGLARRAPGQEASDG